jgi:hypothetical protein
MAPLDDITIYDLFNSLNLSEQEQKVFGHEKKFICELFHYNMNKYKPPHTSRICLNVALTKQSCRPSYDGSICHSSHYFNRDKYFNLDKNGKYQFLLDYIYGATMRLAEELKWNKDVFIDTYNRVKQMNFLFKVEFPAKFSRDRQKKGQAILEKTEERSILSLHIFGSNIDDRILLFDKMNSYPLDASNKIAKQCKWIDNDKFGYQNPKSKLTIHYNCITKKRFRNMKFWEEKYEPLRT